MRIAVALPFHWTGLLDFLRPRAVGEGVGADSYQRGDVTVRFDGRALITNGDPQRVRQLFDADADSAAIDKHLERFPILNVATNRGVRVPGAWVQFELALRAIVGERGRGGGGGRLMEESGGAHV